MQIQIIFLVAVGITLASGIAATSIVMLGDTRRNRGQRAVAEKFAHIALIGAIVILAMLGAPI
jgi:hypothetical protein